MSGGRASVAQLIAEPQPAIVVFLHCAVGVDIGNKVLLPNAVKAVPANDGVPEFAKTTSVVAKSKFLILTSPTGADVKVQFVIVPVNDALLSK